MSTKQPVPPPRVTMSQPPRHRPGSVIVPAAASVSTRSANPVRPAAAQPQRAGVAIAARAAVPPPPVPRAFAARPTSIQRMEQASLPNAVGYGSLLLTYSAAELKTAAEQLGIGDSYSGHLSQKPGAQVSQTTIKVQQDLAAKCAENRQKAKEARKNADPEVVREQRKDDEYQEAQKAARQREQKSANYGKEKAKPKKSAEDVAADKCRKWYVSNKSSRVNKQCPFCERPLTSHKG